VSRDFFKAQKCHNLTKRLHSACVDAPLFYDAPN